VLAVDDPDDDEHAANRNKVCIVLAANDPDRDEHAANRNEELLPS
jgi:hypothetical protein